MAIESLSNTQFDRFVQFAAQQVEAGQKKAIARSLRWGSRRSSRRT